VCSPTRALRPRLQTRLVRVLPNHPRGVRVGRGQRRETVDEGQASGRVGHRDDADDIADGLAEHTHITVAAAINGSRQEHVDRFLHDLTGLGGMDGLA
jgi:hypothetical protein